MVFFVGDGGVFIIICILKDKKMIVVRNVVNGWKIKDNDGMTKVCTPKNGWWFFLLCLSTLMYVKIISLLLLFHTLYRTTFSSLIHSTLSQFHQDTKKNTRWDGECWLWKPYELKISLTLSNGQCFNWKKANSTGGWKCDWTKCDRIERYGQRSIGLINTSLTSESWRLFSIEYVDGWIVFNVVEEEEKWQEIWSDCEVYAGIRIVRREVTFLFLKRWDTHTHTNAHNQPLESDQFHCGSTIIFQESRSCWIDFDRSMVRSCTNMRR